MKSRRRKFKTVVSDLTPKLIRNKADAIAAGLPPLIAAAEKAVSTFHSGDHHQRKAGSGENFWQFREYDPGDQSQDIDWRQSAKGDHIFVREKEKQTTQSVFFWVQTDKGMQLQHGKALFSKHSAGIVVSLALALLLVRAGERVGSLTEPKRASKGEPALQNLAEMLWKKPALLSNGPQLPIAGTLPRHSSAVLCGDFLTSPESLDMTLGLLANRAPQGLIVQILDPAEYDLPFNGRMVFRSVDEMMEFPISYVASIRNAYQEKLHNHIADIQAIARRHRYGHVLYVTRDNPRNILPDCWHALAPQQGQQTGGGV